jgi:hypothetical protein
MFSEFYPEAYKLILQTIKGEFDKKDLLANLPFELKIISKKKNKKKGGSCYFCGNKCNNCTLPFEMGKTIKEFLNNYNE